MKKLIYLLFILIISCTPVPANSLPVSTSPLLVTTSLPPSIPVSSSFVYSQECPHVCWLGINPSATTAEQARAILSSSSQIDQASYIEDDTGVRFEWYSDSRQSLPTRVSIVLENGVVQELIFDFNTIVKIQEFIDLMGQPDEISITKIEGLEARYIDYVVYYLSMNALLFVTAHDEAEYSPNDPVNFLALNVAPDDPSFPIWILKHNEFRQPWLGFGHLEEYLKNRPWPTE